MRLSYKDLLDIARTISQDSPIPIRIDYEKLEREVATNIREAVEEWPKTTQPMTADQIKIEFGIDLCDDDDDRPDLSTQWAMKRFPETPKLFKEGVAYEVEDIEDYQLLDWEIKEWGDSKHFVIICKLDRDESNDPPANWFLWKNGTAHLNSTGLLEYCAETGVDIHTSKVHDTRQFSLAAGYWATRYEAETFLNGFLVQKTLNIEPDFI